VQNIRNAVRYKAYVDWNTHIDEPGNFIRAGRATADFSWESQNYLSRVSDLLLAYFCTNQYKALNMPDYNQLRELCKMESKLSTSVIDEFILHYAAKRNKVDQEFDEKLSRFRHAVKEMPSNWTGLVRAQYMGHRIFRHQGLITKYVNHSAIKDLSTTQQNYLRQVASHPWRFSFSKIEANPARDFYEMQDIFTEETFLLYSTSVNQILSKRPVILWFNLIGFNGDCWQTYGPVTGFQSFDADDIFFFATELNGSIDSESDLMKDVENNPVPYMMLMNGSAYPLVQSGGFEVVHVMSETNSPLFDTQALKKKFKLEYAEGVFKVSDEVLSEPPHFSELYYDEAREIILLSALTDWGYIEMSKKLNADGFNLPADPDIRLHLPMLTVINKLLKRNLGINPYSQLFKAKASPESEVRMEKLNKFMSLALPFINAGEEPDVSALAKKVGIDPEIAGDLLEKSMSRIKEMRK
jgi:hypothetical protein